MVLLHDIRRYVRGSLRISEPLAAYTSFGLGGPADYFVEPASKEDLVHAVRYFQRQGFPYLLIARGSNMLVSDEGYRGAVISLDKALSNIHIEGTPSPGAEGRVCVEAGVQVSSFVEFCVERALQGPEILAGTSGTIGGWAALNLRTPGCALTDRLVEVEVLRNGEIVMLHKTGQAAGERQIDLNGDLILATIFALPPGDKQELLRGRRKWLIRHNAAEPVNLAGSGKIFRDLPGQPAAALIERAAIRRRTNGCARISERNANFIVTDRGAKAADVHALIDLMKREVRKQCNVVLELQVKLVGFDPGTHLQTI